MLAALWAEDLQGVIGKDQTLPWHLPNDLKYFKEMTIGKTIIMGRTTFE
ncbi:MAG: dihydrofolate reductase, partial [Enterococcus aquimarinus]